MILINFNGYLSSKTLLFLDLLESKLIQELSIQYLLLQSRISYFETFVDFKFERVSPSDGEALKVFKLCIFYVFFQIFNLAYKKCVNIVGIFKLIF